MSENRRQIHRELLDTGPGDPKAMATALAIGGAGGFLFWILNMPLAWMLGAGVFCTVATIFRVRLGVEPRFRQVMLVVLGVMLGSGFTPDILGKATTWPLTLALLFVLVGATAFACYHYFRRLGGYDRPTSFFSSIPGGLTVMIVTGGAYGGDDRIISLTHSVRILTAVLTIPLWFRLTHDFGANPAAGFAAGHSAATTDDIAILVVAGIGGWLLGRFARLPAAPLLGPMLLSGAAHLSGLTATTPPYLLIALAQLVLGASIGARFAGMSGRVMLRAMALGVGAAAVMIAIAWAFSLAAARVAGVEFDALLLSFAPGGVNEFGLVALGLNIDIAMVVTHHLARIFMLTLLAPAVYRLWMRRTG
jgi:membrane AbrB-like protein